MKIISIKVPKSKDGEDTIGYVSNDVTLSKDNTSVIDQLSMGEEVDVTMKVTGIREEQLKDGKTEKRVTLSIPITEDGEVDSDKKDSEEEGKVFKP